MNKKLVRLTLVGPLPIKGEIIGGTKVSFRELVNELNVDEKFQVHVVNSSRKTVGSDRLSQAVRELFTIWRVVKSIWTLAPRTDVVMWNVSPAGAIKSGIFVRALCRIRRRPLVIRFFGGDLDVVYRRQSAVGRWVIDRWLFKADTILLQTRELVRWARTRTDTRVAWYPTTRNVGTRRSALPAHCTRFIFVGQLRLEKGLREIVAAGRGLPCNIEITLAGPEMGHLNIDRHQETNRINFIGAIKPCDIPATIASHHALLFPSYYAGEGYPGAVIEAFQLGVPVIASKWRALPEIVEDGVSGLLVEPGDANDLACAMMRIHDDQELFRNLQYGAFRCGARFRNSEVLPLLAKILKELSKR